MATLPDLYSLLGVGREATGDDIRRAYRRLARELHPDVNGDSEAERRFKEVTAAYETLSDPARRQRYDMFGGQGGPSEVFPFGDFGDFGDLFDVFLGGGLGGRRRGGRARPTRARRGEDLAVVLELSFEESVFGVDEDVSIEALAACARCGGSGCEPGTTTTQCSRCAGAGELQQTARSIFGTVMTTRPCPVCDATGEVVVSRCSECDGDGRVPEKRTVPVQVPAGVSDGTDLRISSAGGAGRGGGGPGDLYVSLRVRPHPVFVRRGQDLIATLGVPMTQASLGADLEIQTLDGPERIRLEPGTESGALVRLKGKGVPNLGRRGRGDLFVTVEVETPKAASREERQLIERLAEIRGEGPADKGKGRRSDGRLRRPAGG